MITRINICEYLKQRNQGDILVDLRDQRLYQLGTIKGAVNIPVENILELYQLPKDKTICLFCQAGDYSAEIAELLSDIGYHIYDLSGGYREYLREFIFQSESEENH